MSSSPPMWIFFASLHATCPEGGSQKAPQKLPWAQHTSSLTAMSEKRLPWTLHCPQHSLRQGSHWLTPAQRCEGVERTRKELNSLPLNPNGKSGCLREFDLSDAKLQITLFGPVCDIFLVVFILYGCTIL